MSVEREMELGELLERSIQKLPQKRFVSEEGKAIRNIVGFNLDGINGSQGIYTFSEELADQNVKYVLVQDTMGPEILRGIVIENGMVIRRVGFDRVDSERLAEDLLKGFLGCKRGIPVKDRD